MEEIQLQPTSQVIAVTSHFQAKKDRALSDIELYLNRPAGVGGHATLTDDIIKMFEELERADTMITFVKSMTIVPNHTSQQNVPQQNIPQQEFTDKIGSSGEINSDNNISDK